MLHKFQLEQIKRVNTKKNGQPKKLKVPKKWLFPHSTEREYEKYMYEFCFQIRKYVDEILIPQLPSLLNQATQDNPDPERNDDFLDDLNRLMNGIFDKLTPDQEKLIQQSKKVGIQTAIYNQTQFLKVTNSALGVDLFLQEPWLKDQLKIFAAQNSELIKSFTGAEKDRVSGIVQRGMQEGASLRNVTENIQKSFGITRRHARLIARDQTAKLNGNLTKLRQQEIGVAEYTWQTGQDERVRPTHRVLQGKICSWSDPTIYKDSPNGKWKKRSSIGGTLVHPSTDVMCRCDAYAVLDGVFLDG